MGNALIYARQSKTEDSDDDSYSLDAQRHQLTDHAARLGLTVVAVVNDPDEKGWDDTRPGLAELRRLAATGDISTVLVYDLSRFARSLRIQENVLWELSRLGVELVSLREPEASTNPLFRQLLGAIAEHRTREISGYSRAALKARSRRGLPHGVAPYGYVRLEQGGAYHVDERAAEVIRDLFAGFARGASLTALADDLRTRGVPSPRGHGVWAPETVARILSNRVYLGEVILNGAIRPDAHPAIIDAATWAPVAARRATRRTRRTPRRKPVASWLEGHVRHVCGARMYLFAGHSPGQRPFFRCGYESHVPQGSTPCTALRSYTVAAQAEATVRAILTEALATLVDVDAAISAARAEERAVAPLADRHRRDLTDRAKRATARRAKAEELYLSGSRDRAWFDAQDAAITAEIAATETAIAALPLATDAPRLRATWRQLRSLAGVIAVADDARMAAILAELGTVIIAPEGVTLDYHGDVARFLAPRLTPLSRT